MSIHPRCRESSGSPYAPAVLGQRRDEIDLGWARVIHAQHDPALRLQPHEHRHSALTLVRSGGFHLAWGRFEEDCPQRSVFFKRGGERHSNHFGPKQTRSFVIELYEEQEGQIARDGLSLRLPERSALLGPCAVRLADELEREWRHRDGFTGLALEGQLLLMLATLGRDTARHRDAHGHHEPTWLPAVDEALRDSPQSPPSLAILSGLTGVDAAQLTRIYRRHRGCTIGVMARRIRLDEALRRVQNSTEPIAAIAAALGYYDQAHFTRAFKARFGSTPGRVRRL